MADFDVDGGGGDTTEAQAVPPLESGFTAYLEEKHIGDILRALFTAISVDRPADVLAYMQEQTAVLQTMEPDEEIEWFQGCLGSLFHGQTRSHSLGYVLMPAGTCWWPQSSDRPSMCPTGCGHTLPTHPRWGCSWL